MVGKEKSERSEFELAIEQKVGESIDQIRDMPIDERRRMNERKHGKTMLFVSLFNFIGRGNVLRDRTVSHEEVEAEVDKVLSE
jgi:hypothetical protein